MSFMCPSAERLTIIQDQLDQKKTAFYWMSCNNISTYIYIYTYISGFSRIRRHCSGSWKGYAQDSQSSEKHQPQQQSIHAVVRAVQVPVIDTEHLITCESFVANSDRSPEMSGLFWGISHYCSVRNYCKRKVTILKPLHCSSRHSMHWILFGGMPCRIAIQPFQVVWDTWTRKSRLVSGNRYHPPPPPRRIITHPSSKKFRKRFP